MLNNPPKTRSPTLCRGASQDPPSVIPGLDLQAPVTELFPVSKSSGWALQHNRAKENVSYAMQSKHPHCNSVPIPTTQHSSEDSTEQNHALRKSGGVINMMPTFPGMQAGWYQGTDHKWLFLPKQGLITTSRLISLFWCMIFKVSFTHI